MIGLPPQASSGVHDIPVGQFRSYQRQQKPRKHKARRRPGFIRLLPDRLYSRPTDFIVSDHDYEK